MTILWKVKKTHWRNDRMWNHTEKQAEVVSGWHLLYMLSSLSASAQAPSQACCHTGLLLLEPSHSLFRWGICVHILFMWVYSTQGHYTTYLLVHSCQAFISSTWPYLQPTFLNADRKVLNPTKFNWTVNLHRLYLLNVFRSFSYITHIVWI